MDTETQQLLALLLSNAKGGNKNLSSLLNNIDNPNLLAMAGVLDPYYGMGSSGGGSGQLYGSFAADETTPAAVKAVMDYVDQGMNSYQIEAAINSLDSNVIKDSGYTDEQLISMGKEMSKQGGKKAQDIFAKAGLRNPNEIYSVDDVPLNSKESKMFLDYAGKAKDTDKSTSNYEYALRVAKENYNRLLKEQKGPRGKENKGIQDRDMGSSSVFYNTGAKITPYGGGPEQVYDPSSDVPAVYDPRRKDTRKGGKGQDSMPKGPTQKDRDDISRAQVALYEQNLRVLNDKRRAQAVQEGALNRAASSGRTPYSDQISSMLKFVAGSK
jgi:hypothetical protein